MNPVSNLLQIQLSVSDHFSPRQIKQTMSSERSSCNNLLGTWEQSWVTSSATLSNLAWLADYRLTLPTGPILLLFSILNIDCMQKKWVPYRNGFLSILGNLTWNSIHYHGFTRVPVCSKGCSNTTEWNYLILLCIYFNHISSPNNEYTGGNKYLFHFDCTGIAKRALIPNIYWNWSFLNAQISLTVDITVLRFCS